MLLFIDDIHNLVPAAGNVVRGDPGSGRDPRSNEGGPCFQRGWILDPAGGVSENEHPRQAMCLVVGGGGASGGAGSKIQ